MTKVSIHNTVSFEKKIQKIVSPLHAFKEEAAIWRIGKQWINKQRLIYKANKHYFQQSKLALKHLINPAKNLKITNSPFALDHLIYIDMDTKNGIGSKTDVSKLNDFLVQNFFSDLGIPVINERGGSNWLVVNCAKWDKVKGKWDKVSASEWNSTLKQFGLVLQKLARHLNCTFSEVDCYGSLPDFISLGNEVVDVKTDNKLLFKCPYSDINISQTISFERLKEVIAQMESLTSSSEQLSESIKTSETMKSPGSSFEGVEEKIETLRKAIMTDCFRPTEVMCGKKKRYISPRMIAEYWFVMSWLKKNKDGSMPHRRIGASISMFYRMGIFQNGYDPTVLTTIRNYLSSKNLLSWEDNTYCLGKACKWSVREDVRIAIKDRDICSLSYFVSTTSSQDYIKPKYREEKPMPDGWQDYVESFAWEESGF